ncbi:hypothetical protein CDL12_04192 [Handroanthus impetiginosus]|uniref:Putative plant transposon protein domain-containing protein n=1 Tax=Handroanthus impetiginosus TaxID=429701 RepID=A0A2G9I002_9LAMI|nr:hypothetical protein CDL12_04192 [Handroanthus impetiginosus]
MVRGKNINFSTRAINSLFGTPSINTPGELQEFLKDHPPLDTICELICRDDPQWMLSHLNEPIHFSLTRERVVMIFAILTDFPLNIGRFLHKSIWKSVLGGLIIGLYHPSLINELCTCAGLERQPGDGLLQPDSMTRANRRSAGPAKAPVQPRQRQPPQVGLEKMVDRLADEVHHLQLQQEQQFAYQQQWWALWADQMHIPMNNYPRYPLDEPAEPSLADMGDEKIGSIFFFSFLLLLAFHPYHCIYFMLHLLITSMRCILSTCT